MQDKPYTPPVPLETIRSLFGMDLVSVNLEKVYKNDFCFDAPGTPHQMVSMVLRSNEMEKMAEEFDAAALKQTKENYSIGCISTPEGSCFVYARYKNHNGVYQSAFISATIEKELSSGGQPTYKMTQQSILTGVETEDAGKRYFNPVICVCLQITAEEDSDTLLEDLIDPYNSNEFYGCLCYMQQSMATCLSGNKLDTIRNQLWLDPEITKNARMEFINILGATSVDDVLETHMKYLKLAEKFYLALETEGPEISSFEYGAPKLFMN